MKIVKEYGIAVVRQNERKPFVETARLIKVSSGRIFVSVENSLRSGLALKGCASFVNISVMMLRVRSLKFAKSSSQ